MLMKVLQIMASEASNVDSIFVNEFSEYPPVLPGNQQTTRNVIVLYKQIVTFEEGGYR